MSLSISNYEDRQRHKADISKLTLSNAERKRWFFILEELVMNDGNTEDKALALSMLNGSQGERRSVPAELGNELDLNPGG